MKNTQDINAEAVRSSAWLEELTKILAAGMGRHLDEEASAPCKWLLELPLTDAEYHRLREIVSSSNDLGDGSPDTNTQPTR
jgi:hypothetical protein